MYKKNLSLALVASIFVQILSPMISVSFADSPKTSINTKTSSSSSVRVSKQMSDRLKKQQQRLSSLGNPSEYTRAEIAWDKTQNPSAIRNLRKKSSKNIVADTQAVLKDFSSLYGSGTTKTPDVRLKNQLVSKETNEKHARMKQYYNGLEIVNKDIIAHTDENGEIYQIDGQYAPGINISTVAKITADQELSIGQKEFSLKKEFKVSEKPTLVIYPYASENLLAWRYVIEYNDPKE